MKHTQMEQFAERINRIERGGPNTFATVYTGLQETATPRSKRVSGVTHLSKTAEDPQSARNLLRQGVRSALLRLAVAGATLALFLTFFAG
ncbi:hypothetical protein [Celeribacter neptunius]|uniref:Uncharacterized protein n=1 Tax=Celeribacter neptunius TaxID=588602 RepID=A0A1I3LC53_9RHOB|nr:hypothetical protein [Celeribacter neptunius]SFI82298.1 hypothetical protein SAMN04487991_0969 [Celeribacter neptunius]